MPRMRREVVNGLVLPSTSSEGTCEAICANSTTPVSRRRCALSALTAIGTSWNDCSRRAAVTTISSICCPSTCWPSTTCAPATPAVVVSAANRIARTPCCSAVLPLRSNCASAKYVRSKFCVDKLLPLQSVSAFCGAQCRVSRSCRLSEFRTIASAQGLRRNVSDGSSPKHSLYARENSPKCQKPQLSASVVTVVDPCVAARSACRTRCSLSRDR